MLLAHSACCAACCDGPQRCNDYTFGLPAVKGLTRCVFHALAGGGADAHAEIRQPALQVQRPHRCCRCSCFFVADAARAGCCRSSVNTIEKGCIACEVGCIAPTHVVRSSGVTVTVVPLETRAQGRCSDGGLRATVGDPTGSEDALQHFIEHANVPIVGLDLNGWWHQHIQLKSATSTYNRNRNRKPSNLNSKAIVGLDRCHETTQKNMYTSHPHANLTSCCYLD